MDREVIKNRFKKTKLGKKIFKKYRKTLIIFILTHIIMLACFVLFVSSLSSILSGNIQMIHIIIALGLILSAVITFITGFMTIYYDGKIVGCIELFDLMLKAKVKTGNNAE